MTISIFFFLLLSSIHSLPYSFLINTQLNDNWELYKIKYEKTYETLEEIPRRFIWEQNIKYIQKHNIRYDLGEYTYFLGINQFADMTHREFKDKYLRLNKQKPRNNSLEFMIPLNLVKLPENVDWVTEGYVTPVKNQGGCGSCWSFSATGSLEGQYFRKYKELVSFSEQQLVDCSKSYDNDGCNGGIMNNAFNYIKDFGIEKEDDYRYNAVGGICKYNSSKIATKISGYTNIKKGDENQLAIAVATQGPISIAIDASNPSFQLYKGGIYDEQHCSNSKLDHGVIIVGYGVEDNEKYWKVKNSWGRSWGLSGYIKIRKDNQNQCGIASLASYPII